MHFTEQFDVVVVGAGHAGCEAAMASARMGLKTALYTLNLDLIAQMSCNPAVGGIAKGHLVREVDALGGIMGEVTDAVGIQFRDGRTVGAQAVIITTGTFLNGLIHCGEQQYPAGRSGEPPAVLLGEALKKLGLRGCRLKTGTPPRLDGRTIDWSRFAKQPGDEDPTPFSFRTKRVAHHDSQVPCYIAWTTAETHRI